MRKKVFGVLLFVIGWLSFWAQAGMENWLAMPLRLVALLGIGGGMGMIFFMGVMHLPSVDDVYEQMIQQMGIGRAIEPRRGDRGSIIGYKRLSINGDWSITSPQAESEWVGRQI